MATPNEHHDEQYGEERSPWSKPSVMLSGMFVLALLLGGIAFLIFNGGNSTHHTHAGASATSNPAGSATAPATTGAGPTGSCSLPAGNQSIPSASPPSGTQWGQVGSMSVPQAPTTLGPEHTSGVWNTCFAHSPSGALLAAMNFWAEGTHGAANAGQTYAHLAVDVPRAALSATDHLDDDGPLQYAGYKYVAYSPSEAQLLLALKGPEGKLVAARTLMTWTGADWRYLFPPGGQLSLETISDLTGYVPWSGF